MMKMVPRRRYRTMNYKSAKTRLTLCHGQTHWRTHWHTDSVLNVRMFLHCCSRQPWPWTLVPVVTTPHPRPELSSEVTVSHIGHWSEQCTCASVVFHWPCPPCLHPQQCGTRSHCREYWISFNLSLSNYAGTASEMILHRIIVILYLKSRMNPFML